jgi:hypothetical protein
VAVPAAITIVDTTSATLAVKSTLTLNAASAGYDGIVFAPDLGKAYASSQTTPDGGFGAEVDEIDLSSHAFKTVAAYQSAIDGALGMTYDPNQHRVYVSVDDAHYLYVIDATTDALVSTWPSSILTPSGIGSGFGAIQVDPAGNYLYMVTGDINDYPMVGTIPTDGGPPFDVLGGQASGWVKSTGLVLVTTDAGASGATAILASDGGAFMQLIDPATFQLAPGDTIQAVWADRDNTVSIAVLDSCGKRRVRVYSVLTGTELWSSEVGGLGGAIYYGVVIDPASATGGTYHVVVNIQPDSGSSSGGGATNDSVVEMIIDKSATPAPPCP